MRVGRAWGVAVALVVVVGFASSAQAISIPIAVWADGQSGDPVVTWLSGALGVPYSVTEVTTADLETSGFLSGFNALFVTRFGGSFGFGLTTAAAANVQAYVGTGGTAGNVVLFPGDWKDMTPGGGESEDANVESIIIQGVQWAAGSGHGYVGEFNGAAMAMTANGDGFEPLDFVPGTAAPINIFGFDKSLDIISLTPAGVGKITGVTFPFVPTESLPYRVDLSGVPSGLILATYADGASAIVINQFSEPTSEVPEPATLVLLIGGLVGAYVARRRRAA